MKRQCKREQPLKLISKVYRSIEEIKLISNSGTITRLNDDDGDQRRRRPGGRFQFSALGSFSSLPWDCAMHLHQHCSSDVVVSSVDGQLENCTDIAIQFQFLEHEQFKVHHFYIHPLLLWEQF